MSAVEPIALPVTPEPADSGLLAVLRRRVSGTFAVDPWGLDHDLVDVASWAAALRWHLDVTGIEHVPESGPAVLVCNRRSGVSEPAVLVSAIARRTERHLRPVGCPDVDPIGPVLRRFGAIQARPDEVAGALRDGQLVALPTGRELRRFELGRIPLELLEPAVLQRTPVLPVAVTGWELGRSWSIRIGAPVSIPRGAGPRVVAKLAVRVADEVAGLLAEAEAATRWHRLRDGVLGDVRNVT